jgi:hypothetical protein
VAVAEKIRRSLSEPYRLAMPDAGATATIISHHCTASIGIAVFLDHEASRSDILRWADAAMYQAKGSGAATPFGFMPKAPGRLRRRSQRRSTGRQAIDPGRVSSAPCSAVHLFAKALRTPPASIPPRAATEQPQSPGTDARHEK